MHLLPEPLFTVPIDETDIVITIKGTTGGRILMGARHGCIYEFFLSGLSLVSRPEKGTIKMYDLDTDGQAMTRVTAIGINTIVQSVANIAERRIVPVSDRWLVLRPSSRANRPTCIWSQINASVVRLYLNTLS